MLPLYNELQKKKQEYHKAGELHHNEPHNQKLLKQFKTAKEAYHRVKTVYHNTGDIPHVQQEGIYEEVA